MTKTKKSEHTAGLWALVGTIGERFWGPAWKLLLVLWILRMLIKAMTRRHRGERKPIPGESD